MKQLLEKYEAAFRQSQKELEQLKIGKQIHPSYLERLKDLEASGDPEYAHGKADDILCGILKDLGFEEIVEAYDKVPKWCA